MRCAEKGNKKRQQRGGGPDGTEQQSNAGDADEPRKEAEDETDGKNTHTHTDFCLTRREDGFNAVAATGML